MPAGVSPYGSPLRAQLGLSGTSSATTTPQYQPFGAMRERSDSFDPASFLRRQAYQYQRGLTDQSYGQRANEARALAGQQGAQAGLGGGAALSNTNDALRNVLLARSNEMGQLGAQYMGGEAQAAEAAAGRAQQLGLAQLSGEQALQQISAENQGRLGLQTQKQQWQYTPQAGLRVPGLDRDLSPMEYNQITDAVKTLVGTGKFGWRDALDYILGNNAGHTGRNNPNPTTQPVNQWGSGNPEVVPMWGGMAPR